jgi:streptogramin lyase
MDFKDGSLWCTDSALARIYKLEPATGKVIEQYDAPSRDVRGICWVGTDLWVSDQNTKRLIKVKLVDFRKLLAQ